MEFQNPRAKQVAIEMVQASMRVDDIIAGAEAASVVLVLLAELVARNPPSDLAPMDGEQLAVALLHDALARLREGNENALQWLAEWPGR
jgi:hypothetical protein